MKPIDFSCILRLAKSQMMENGFKDAVVDRLYALLLEYTANISHSIAFPDTILLAVIQVSKFCIFTMYNRRSESMYLREFSYCYS